jgi:ribosomal protein S27AE
MKNKIEILRRNCLRCGHAWLIRTEQEPRACPNCHSPYWNRQRKEKNVNTQNEGVIKE